MKKVNKAAVMVSQLANLLKDGPMLSREIRRRMGWTHRQLQVVVTNTSFLHLLWEETQENGQILYGINRGDR